VILVKLECFD